MKTNSNFCIYCGKSEVTERDHVPPKCFFPKPLPSDLITVPSCSDCNRGFGKIDEYIRNILISLDDTEKNPKLISLREKMHRSFLRVQSKNLLLKIYNSIVKVEKRTKSGIILGNLPAFDMNNKEFNSFFERIARALLYVERDIEYFEGKFDWFEIEDFSGLPNKIQSDLKNDKWNSNAGGMFKYYGYYQEGIISSLWFVKLYDKIVFKILAENV